MDQRLLRVQQGREVIVGLRSEAVRLAKPSEARPGEVAISGLVEHVEFQGHEVLVHFNTGSRPAVVPDLEAPRPVRPVRRRRREGSLLDRLRDRRAGLRAGPVVDLDDPADAGAGRDDEMPPEGRLPGDLVVRTTPTSTSGTACRYPSSSTSPICSSSTSTANASAPLRRGCGPGRVR